MSTLMNVHMLSEFDTHFTRVTDIKTNGMTSKCTPPFDPNNGVGLKVSQLNQTRTSIFPPVGCVMQPAGPQAHPTLEGVRDKDV
jgi:hypothetical protein